VRNQNMSTFKMSHLRSLKFSHIIKQLMVFDNEWKNTSLSILESKVWSAALQHSLHVLQVRTIQVNKWHKKTICSLTGYTIDSIFQWLIQRSRMYLHLLFIMNFDRTFNSNIRVDAIFVPIYLTFQWLRAFFLFWHFNYNWIMAFGVFLLDCSGLMQYLEFSYLQILISNL